MGQYFYPSCLSRAETLKDGGGKLGEILFDGTPAALVELLAVPVRPDLHTPRQSDGFDSRIEKGDKGQSKFATLPDDLHRMIFDALDYIEDVLSLGLVNLYFWEMARPHILNFHTDKLGFWAGEEIICVGDYIQAADYPTTFSEAAISKLQQIGETLKPVASRVGNEAFTLFHYIETFREVECKISWELLDVFRTPSFYKEYETRSYAADIYNTLMPDNSYFYPVDQLWILRNLTTREYVRSEALTLDSSCVRGPHIDVAGFGEVVMSRVCWSSNPSVSMAITGNIHRGVWAGHRLDIVTWNMHKQQTRAESDDVEDNDWRDISNEISKEITSILETA